MQLPLTLQGNSKITAVTNIANTYALTNDPTPGAWNTGPATRFTVTVPESATLSASTPTAFYITVSNADWTTAGTAKPQFSTFGITVGAATGSTSGVTNYITTALLSPSSLWTATNLVGGQAIAIPGVNGTLVDKQ